MDQSSVWIVSPSLVLGDVTVALCARRSLVCLSQILPAFPGTQLTATHRQGHKKHDEHDGYGNYDDNDSRRDGRHGDQQGVAHFVLLQVLSLRRYPDAAGLERTEKTRPARSQDPETRTFIPRRLQAWSEPVKRCPRVPTVPG